MAVVEDLEGGGLLAVDDGHQLLVGEALHSRLIGIDTSVHRFNIRCGRTADHARQQMESMQESGRRPRPAERIPRLYLLVAGAGLCLLGVSGFFFDADFGTGTTSPPTISRAF